MYFYLHDFLTKKYSFYESESSVLAKRPHKLIEPETFPKRTFIRNVSTESRSLIKLHTKPTYGFLLEKFGPC